ncbi:probable ubiquitin carboxyl-terminal hydrolase MINDY-4 isoform X6 [Heterocephalus glaber]|uniref:Ubiquitin carboxyl-terminal hydrolase MINDY n=1 Tax=Heterocephalus glaber TaxID=10181 RepID=A0AAX6R8M2_HETGA|nr:probable ubiquitin carboxyl-terminal hydrolase MINDY-4 isoform X6 [Heterocephalus glaber]
MDSLFVEEVAASLVREFLSRKGLKKTCVTMDQERPRSDLSINSRNDLRKVLHLELLYKENKAKEKPLKTSLELITRYFLDYSGNVDKNLNQETPIPALSIPKKDNKLLARCSETTLVNIYDLSDEDTGWRTSLAETSKARQDSLDGDIPGNLSCKRPPHKSKPGHIVPDGSTPLASAWEKVDKLHLLDPCTDVKKAGEKARPKSGLIFRGMMAGPMDSSSQDSFHKRSLRWSLTSSSKTQRQEEENPMVPDLSGGTPARLAPQVVPASSNDSISRSPLGQLSEPSKEKQKTTPSSPSHLPSKGLLPRDRAPFRGLSGDEPAVDGHTEGERISPKLYLPGGNPRVIQERLERAFKHQGSQPSPLRKSQLPASDKVDDELGALRLEDVEDELITEDIILAPAPSMLKLQIVSKPIDLSAAKEIKTLLFGSTFCCFNEEWRLQSFSFSDIPSLRYGIVQSKAAAAFRCPSHPLPGPGHCRYPLAGWEPKASCGHPLMLHSVTCYEELVTFLQHTVHQFEVGPYGCILLTLSAILSRSSELVRQDFDVPTSHLIGAHGYCTQELVNLLLTGRAVSNVFNDVVELDSGNGNITLLRGISAQSDIGFLSLFEHYSVCQVGCFLKTPKFPIWVVCSESHFSVLFSPKPELLSDWRAERLFDLYYYDGLANQQEEIRLTVDTTRTIPEDSGKDLIPPLELCIRTKWKGASVNWNGSDPIL